MPKTIGFVLLEPFADWEAAYLSSALSMLGHGAYETKFFSKDGAPVRSIGGLLVKPDGTMDDAVNCDALALIGGFGWRTPAAQDLVPYVQQWAASGRPFGAICDAAGFLATLGILNDGRAHTGNGLDDLCAWGGAEYTGASTYCNKQAVCCDHLITANGTAALEFAREFLLDLGLDPALVDEWYVFHKKGFCEAGLPDSPLPMPDPMSKPQE